ncbi:MAG: NAD(P)H-dependent oxidoreductase subunit E, partial [Christensenellales bacterium]
MGKKLDPKLFEALEQVIARYKDQKGPLMPVMQAAQNLFGYLPIEVQDYIARGLDVPLVKVYGVATFYSQFKLEPNGENTVSVCLGTACYVRGAQKVLDRLKEELGIEEGKTTPDG